MGGEVGRLAISLGAGLAATGVGLPFGVGFLGAAAVSSLILGNRQKIEGPKIDDSPPPSSTLGKPIPIVRGVGRVPANVIYWGPLITEERTETAGKGGPKITTFAYFRTVGISICRGPMGQLLKVLADKKVIIDLEAVNGASPAYPYRWYPGDETQEPNADIQALSNVTAADVSAHRGTSYIVFTRFPLSNHGNRFPLLEFLVAESASDVFLAQAVEPPPTELERNIRYWVGDPLRPMIFAASESENNSIHTGYMKVDTLTGDVLVARENPWENFAGDLGGNLLNKSITPPGGAVDRFGHLWTFARFSGGASIFRALYKLNKDTLEPSISGSQPGIALTLHTFSVIDVPARPAYGALTRNGHDTIDLYHLGDTSLPNVDVSTTGFDHLKELNEGTDFGDSGQGGAWGTCFDSDGVLWSVGNARLYKIEFVGETTANLRIVQTTTFDLSALGLGSLFRDLTYWVDGRALVIIGFATNGSGQGGKIILWDIDTDTGRVLADGHPWDMTGTIANIGNDNTPMVPWIYGDRFVLGEDNGKFYIFNLVSETLELSLTVSQYVSSDFSASTSSQVPECWYDRFSSSAWLDVEGNRFYMPTYSGSFTTLKAVMEFISDEAGMVAADYDYATLTDVVRGYRIDKRMTARAAVEGLMLAFMFDVIESDWKLKGVKRFGSSGKTIPEIDLGAAVNRPASEVDRLPTSRKEEKDLPLKLEVRYLDYTADHQPSVDHDSRNSDVVESTEILSVDLPIVLLPAEAATIARKILVNTWAERELYDFSTLQRYLRLDPADVITVNHGTDALVVRVTDTVVGADLRIAFKAVLQELYLDSLSLSSEVVSGFTPQVVAVTGSTELVLIDTAMLRDVDDDAGVYLAARPLSGTSFPGTSVEVSEDAVAFDDFAFVPSESVVGVSIGAVADHVLQPTWDLVNTISVSIASNKSLATQTRKQVRGGANTCLVGSEIIGFTTAVKVTDTQWTLSELIRGRNGTERHVSTHVVSETFVLLDTTTLANKVMDLAKVGVARFYRATTVGQLFDTRATIDFTNTAGRLSCYAPTRVRMSVGTDDERVVTWSRRNRTSGKNFNIVPMIEATEDYELDVLTGPGGTVVGKYTTAVSAQGSVISAATRTFTYATGDQESDGVYPDEAVTVRIYQMNALIGRGASKEATLTP